MRKSQVSVEFIMLFGFMFVVFLLFFVFIEDRRIEINRQHHQKVLQDIAAVVDSELKLAVSVDDNYVRNFTLPAVLLSKKYNFSVENGTNGTMLFARFTDPSFSGLEAPVLVPRGVAIANITAGTNVIFKREGIVFVNTTLPG